jgi:membrane protease YdiL (CAAX protease family)
MKNDLPNSPSFWKTFWLLMATARRRSDGRGKRQQELLAQRRKKSNDWSGLGFAMTVLLMVGVNVAAAFLIRSSVESGERVQVEREGKIVVSNRLWEAAKTYEAYPNGSFRDSEFSREATRIAEEYGGSSVAIEKRLRNAIHAHGTRDLVAENEASPDLNALPNAGGFASMWGSLILMWWGMMLVFQGEGLELDIQRRRHPIWEWLFTHPVPPGAVFLAEMFSPIAANPVYWGAPLCVGTLYGFVYDPVLGLLAALLIGIPVAIAAACLGKALEIAATLRFSPRTRGAVIGLMSWFGYASLMFFFVGLFFIPKLVTITSNYLAPLTVVPWPWLGMLLGVRPDGSFSFIWGVFFSVMLASMTVAGSVWFSVWGAKQGLGGPQTGSDSAPSMPRIGRRGFGKDPLYRKEFLWFIRDRSAIVQSILVPLTVAGIQVFNFRGLLSKAQGEWNYLCGAAILFGTYFLWVLGPRSLSSEGTALWIAMTWPRGMESLLKAKAWLWSLVSTGMVALVLCYAAFLFPANTWSILLVGVGWFFFSRSMAEKTVTLVSAPDSSGEHQPIHWGRKWAAQLGMLTFAIGVLTQQWPLAVNGIVYSYVTAAAMWQNFRARLPYLYDPWSEEVPPPPTLMHAMIAISLLVEGGAVITGIVVAAGGREHLAAAQAVGYAISSVIVWLGMSSFLSGRDVPAREIWEWRPAGIDQSSALLRAYRVTSLMHGALGGIALALFSYGYIAVLGHIPATEEIIRKSQEQLTSIPGLRISYFVMAVGFAPFAEEYLFRGLLFRALDREWGGWRAVVGSAAFFAIYHPPLSWLPVALLGVANALLFKRSRSLVPPVILHMVYNALVLLR